MSSQYFVGGQPLHSLSQLSRDCRTSALRPNRRKAQLPGLFEVQVVTPPKTSLGIHALDPSTHNGDKIQVDGKDFVVSSLVLKYRLERGKYVRDHNRLDVQELSRYFLNMHLDTLMKGPPPRR